MGEVDRKAFLSDLLGRLDLEVSPGALPRLLWYLEELLRWNRRINLTAITDFDQAIEKHLVDSLTLLPFIEGHERLLDLGSGGGVPGIPLKLARPGLQLTSVDSVGKKIAFQRHVARCLDLDSFVPLQERAENLPLVPHLAAGFDLVISRAFASLDEFVRLARPCLAPGGHLLAMKGREGKKEVAESQSCLTRAGVMVKRLVELRLPLSGAERSLIILGQVSESPPDMGSEVASGT